MMNRMLIRPAPTLSSNAPAWLAPKEKKTAANAALPMANAIAALRRFLLNVATIAQTRTAITNEMYTSVVIGTWVSLSRD